MSDWSLKGVMYLQSDALLPAIATLLRATPQEFRELKLAIVASKQSSWWPA
jgi:hypothetical protein